jgi:hypothetical protein
MRPIAGRIFLVGLAFAASARPANVVFFSRMIWVGTRRRFAAAILTRRQTLMRWRGAAWNSIAPANHYPYDESLPNPLNTLGCSWQTK